MYMKQFLLKSLVARLMGLVITFFMIASMDGIAQTTHSVGSTNDWNTAVSSLSENDIIKLTADVTMDQDNMPTVVCTIDGGGFTLTREQFNLKAPVIFSNTKLSGNYLFADGHTLKFVGGDNSLSGDLYGGGVSGEVVSTNVIIEGGAFGYINGGGYKGNVTGECRLTISGTPTITGAIYGGSNQAGTSVGSTHVEISGGTFGYINGGGWSGNVTGECYLKISGNPTIVGNVFGGSNQKGTTVGSTHVEISGGTFKREGNEPYGGSIFAGGWGCTVNGNTAVYVTGGTIGHVYGGCSQGEVKGTTYVEIDGATIDGGSDGSTNYSAGSIYGGGFGDDNSVDGYTESIGKVGSTQIIVKNITSSGAGGVIVFGGGEYAGVAGNTDITIEGGDLLLVCGSSRVVGTIYQGSIGGNVNILVKGGKIEALGAAEGQRPDEAVPVVGDMNLRIEGGIITRRIDSGNNLLGGDYKSCTLTICNQGSESNPFLLPQTVAVSDIVLIGSTVAFRETEDLNYLMTLDVREDYPTEISGDGKLVGNVYLSNLKSGPLPTDKTLVIGGEQLKGATFGVYKDAKKENGHIIVTSTPVYKAGNTYRSGENTTTTTTLRTVSITHPTGGKISAVWDIVNQRNTVLEDGDQVPDNTTLTLSVVPDEGYQGGTVSANGSELLGATYQVTADVAFTVTGLTAIPYTVTVAALTNGSISATPNADVTIGTPVNLTITPASGYRLKSGSLKVYKTGDESTTVTVSGNSFSMPAYNVTVFAEFENIPYVPEPDPEPTVFYTVSVPAVEGVVTDPVAGDYEIEAWSSFRFYLTLYKEYDQSEPIITTDRGETIQPRSSDGAYIVKYVRSDVEISIDGIVKNPDPVANAEIQSGTKAWVNNHQLFIRTDKQEKVSIYTFDGQLRKTFLSAGGEEHVALSSGSYIVRIGQNNFKVIL